MKRIINHSLTVILILSLIVLMISFSIAIPMYFRPFYYLHINGLDLVEKTKYSFYVIKNAYDDVLDYLLFNQPFSTGELKYSIEGKSHFEDCKILFNFNSICLILSFAISSTILFFCKIKKIELKRYLGFHPMFFSSIFTLFSLTCGKSPSIPKPSRSLSKESIELLFSFLSII